MTLQVQRYVTIAACLFFMAEPLHGQLSTGRESLVGVVKMGLTVDVNWGTTERGVEEGWLLAMTESRLRSAGIDVVNQGPGPIVWVSLTTLDSPGGYGASLGLTLQQEVTTDNGSRVWGITWNRTDVLAGPPGTFQGNVEQRLGGLLDVFLNDWGAANPQAEKTR